MKDFTLHYKGGLLNARQLCLKLRAQMEALLDQDIFSPEQCLAKTQVNLTWGEPRDGYFASLCYTYHIPPVLRPVLGLVMDSLYDKVSFNDDVNPLYQINELRAITHAWPNYSALERLRDTLNQFLSPFGFFNLTWRLIPEEVLNELQSSSPQFYLKLQEDYRLYAEAEVGHYQVTGFNLRRAWFLDLEALLSQAAYPNQIYSLDLSHCRLERLPDALFRFKQLQVLSIQGSEALAQDPRLADLPRLKQVNT